MKTASALLAFVLALTVSSVRAPGKRLRRYPEWRPRRPTPTGPATGRAVCG